MTSKPTNGRALFLATCYVNHPELDGTDTALLCVLAVNGDYGTGKNCRPGNAALGAAAKLKWSATHVRIAKLTRLNLIEQTFRSTGRLASIYRICLENPAFPDCTPTGESLIEKPSGLNRTVPEKPSGDSAETVQSTGDNHTFITSEPSGLGHGTIRSGPDHTNPASETHQPPTTRDLDGWISSMYATMGVADSSVRTKLDELVASDMHGFDYLKRAVQIFENRPSGLIGLKYPWRMFLRESTQCMADAKKQVQNSSAWCEQNIPGYREQCETSIKRQAAENLAFMMKEPTPQNGGAAEDYLAELA